MTQGRCFKCKWTVNIVNAKENTGKNNRKFIIGNCSNGCKKKDGNLVKVSRAVSSKTPTEKKVRIRVPKVSKRKNALVWDNEPNALSLN